MWVSEIPNGGISLYFEGTNPGAQPGYAYYFFAWKLDISILWRISLNATLPFPGGIFGTLLGFQNRLSGPKPTRVQKCLLGWVTHISVSKQTLWAVAGPHGQLASVRNDFHGNDCDKKLLKVHLFQVDSPQIITHDYSKAVFWMNFHMDRNCKEWIGTGHAYGMGCLPHTVLVDSNPTPPLNKRKINRPSEEDR